MTHRGTRRSKAVLMAACAALVMVPASAHAKQAQEASFRIEAKDLGTALTDLARQSNREIYFSADLTRGKRAPRLNGKMSVEKALRRLLANTGLTYRLTPNGSIVVESKTGNAAADDSASSLGGASPGAGEAIAGGPEDYGESEEIVVTGTNIRGVPGIGSSTIVINRDQLERSNYSSLADVFDDIPQNFPTITPEGGFGDGSSLSLGNGDFASAVDLRGLGAGSTLTLVDGARRAGSVGGQVVDISTIPVSIIERVEVVTGGRSAIYGSDAVAGVVNIVLRRKFDGASTQIFWGSPLSDRGGARLNFNQIFGLSNDRSSIVASYDYTRDQNLDLVKSGLVSSPTPTGSVPIRKDLFPKGNRHTGYLALRSDLSDDISVSLDGIFSSRKSIQKSIDQQPSAPLESTDRRDHKSNQFSVGGDVTIGLGSWKARTNLRASGVNNESASSAFSSFEVFDFTVLNSTDDSSRMYSATVVADGPLPEMGSLAPKLAVGAEIRREEVETRFTQEIHFLGSTFPSERHLSRSRTVKSAFGELVIAPHNRTPSLANLTLSVAGRYDEYSFFGGAFSPQASITWRPASSLSLFGSVSRAYRAPALAELGSSTNASIYQLPDSGNGGELTYVLSYEGGNPNVGPERATVWNAGVEISPPSSNDLKLSLAFFSVDYRDRLETVAVDLVNAAQYEEIIDRNPTSSEVDAIISSAFLFNNATDVPFNQSSGDALAAFPGLIVFDGRVRNLGIEKVRGLDFQAEASFETRLGTFQPAINATYTFSHKRSVTSTSPVFDANNEIGKPVNFRAHGSLAWQSGWFSGNLAVHYTDDYRNQRTIPISRVDSWTTADIALRVQVPRDAATEWLRGTSLTVAINNIFDNDPPLITGNGLGLLYDVSNASPLGRYASISLSKRF